MSGRRIADGGVASPHEQQAPRTSEGLRLSAAIASPRGVLVTVPLLVVLVGVSLTLVGQNALEDVSRSMARDRFVEQMSFAGETISFALSKADPVLQRMHELQDGRTSTDSPDVFARALRDLVAGRSGMTQAYIGFPDGTFQGVYVADDGELRFQESRVGDGGGKFRHYRFAGNSIIWTRDEPTDYDPRKRAWWGVAVKAGKRAWTEPYPFFTGQLTGVTRVEPILVAGSLKSVIAVDFDVSALSAFLANSESRDVHSLVFDDGGVLLAYPHAKDQIAKRKSAEHALTYKDIDDPLLEKFFQMLPSAGAELSHDFAHFEVNGEPMLATVAPIGGATSPPWRVAVMVSEQSFLSALKKHRRQSLLIASAALVVAVFAAWVLARHIVRARRAVAVARAAADAASREAMELGSYKLLECLGKGGMGEVWRAEHRLLAREAAIKLINAELTKADDREQIQERFKREAQTIASLRSRNTVELFDYGVTGDGTFFFVMELLDGIDLETLTERHGPQPASRVVSLLLQMCNSLAEAHDAGLVHRDIKPANVFICRAAEEVDVVKVLDFGLVLADAGKDSGAERPDAKGHSDAATGKREPVSARLTAQGAYLGTPTFMPPEQALGIEVDGRADLYALGCVGWWLLTGRLVFPANDAMAALTAHMTHTPPPLRPLVKGDLPPELERLIVQCLAKSPSERPESARAVSRVLRSIQFEAAEAWTNERSQAWWRELGYGGRPSGAPVKSAIGSMDTVLSGKPTVPRERSA